MNLYPNIRSQIYDPAAGVVLPHCLHQFWEWEIELVDPYNYLKGLLRGGGGLISHVECKE